MIIQQSIRLTMLLFLALVSLTSCERFYPDPLDPRLPIYSETGKNQVGAIVNGSVYIDYPRYIASRGGSSIAVYGRDSLHISFFIYDKTNREYALSFKLKGISDEDWLDMEIGNGKKFPIDNDKLKFTKNQYDDVTEASVEFLEGKMTIKHLPGSNVMAGTFGLTLRTTDQKTEYVHYGRYDIVYSNMR